MKSFLTLTFLLCLSAGSSAFAQNPPQQPPQPQERASHETPAVTLVGCLTKGASANEYVISDTKTGEKTSFSGSEKLEQYVNHTVQIAGKMSNKGAEKSFTPDSIKTVSDSCQSQ